MSSDVEYKSDAFWELFKKVSVESHMQKAGHKYSSTMLDLASGIKKLQAITEDDQGTQAVVTHVAWPDVKHCDEV